MTLVTIPRVLSVLVIVWICLLLFWSTLPNFRRSFFYSEDGRRPFICKEIDVVYTWVNGSDPNHIKSRMERSATAADKRYAFPSNSRFRDMGGLQYSLRSLIKYANWIRKVYIVSADQVPSYLNVNNPRVRVVSHSEIFKQKSDLPTFNSNAIEGNLYNLPDDVADCFIYLNDDMLFLKEVSATDFVDPHYGQVLYQSSWTAPPPPDKMSNIWHRSILHCNRVLDKVWGPARRHYPSHGPYFFSKEVLKDMYWAYSNEFDSTSTHPFRAENDTSLPFLYMHHTYKYFNSYLSTFGINNFVKVTNDLKGTQMSLDRLRSRRPKAACINDALSNDDPNPEVIKYLEENFYKQIFPDKSEFEL
eukprot:TRINITY_DN1288_c0_g1_i1.p1 TRINITY_DN1288_c0_g1~~TRINITY_DN1288_c0_g1_i1.p1  ORF type:complete len:360 (+),score=34.21 TRINITY_DN1288_c0_g1_i1:262-1341(+)